MNLLLVMIGGGLGSGCRYGVNLLSVRIGGGGFPWGTLAVNLTGCLLIGAVLDLAARTNLISSPARLFFVAGFLGAFTTFSSYAAETIVAADAGSFQTAVLNVLANNVLGLALVLAGMRLARYLA